MPLGRTRSEHEERGRSAIVEGPPSASDEDKRESVSPRPSPTSSLSLGRARGEFLVELREREAGRTGGDEVTFLIRPNAGLPFAPIADTASGGESPRIALALAAVAGGETLVFDEIDAGIGGVTAHAAKTLQRPCRARAGPDHHAPSADRDSSRTRTSASRRCPATRRTRASRRSTICLRREEIERMAGGAEFIML